MIDPDYRIQLAVSLQSLIVWLDALVEISAEEPLERIPEEYRMQHVVIATIVEYCHRIESALLAHCHFGPKVSPPVFVIHLSIVTIVVFAVVVFVAVPAIVAILVRVHVAKHRPPFRAPVLPDGAETQRPWFGRRRVQHVPRRGAADCRLGSSPM
jgi:hypothetical protein